MIFKCRKDIFHSLVFYLIPLILIICIIFLWQDETSGITEKLIVSIVLSLVILLMIWISFSTYYELQDSELKYKSGPLNGKIKISSIRKIEMGKTMWAGTLKPATAQKGLIIHYNKFDEIYISPDSNEKFVEEILKLNPSIHIQKFT